MDCESCQSHLSAFIDDQLAPDVVRRTRNHLLGCPVCAAEMADLMATVHALHALSRPLPTRDPWNAIAFVLRREGLVRPWYRRARPLGFGAAAAGVVVALYTYSALRPAPPSAPLEAYWREHAIFSAQDEPTYSSGGPALEAIEATYHLQGTMP